MKDTPTEAKIQLQHFLQNNMGAFEGVIRAYVIRMGLMYGETVQSVVNDVLNEAALEALSHAERFAAVREPRAWFMAIATNILKRKRSTSARKFSREQSFSALEAGHGADRESNFFDQIAFLSQPGPEQEVEAREQVLEMLRLVSSEDQNILRLAILYDLDTQSLARSLNVSPGTARVRLHRALNRLRIAWNRHEEK